MTILAGGTDLMVQYIRGDIDPTILLHVRRLEELKGIESGTRTEIGAVTTHWQIGSDTRLRASHPALTEAAATVGGRQTQNVGTLAGNVVNASPAADLLPVLLISDAFVSLTSASGSRELPVADFVIGRRVTQRKPDELVTKLSLEPVSGRSGETYLKIGRRAAMEVAVVGLAARLTFDQSGAVSQARIAVCSVATKALRAPAAEERLLGSKLEEDAIIEAGELLRRTASPIDDSRATAAYRSRLLAPLLRRAVLECRKRAGLEV
ncbi:MAG: FAD binding domain-containing protein [Candidatus Dormibacteraeota bacterium]|nr:FAD binding domain-containing protein [Candidatus Dormibacteraeota bacterium]